MRRRRDDDGRTSAWRSGWRAFFEIVQACEQEGRFLTLAERRRILEAALAGRPVLLQAPARERYRGPPRGSEISLALRRSRARFTPD